jgi:hypothetical protein
MVDLEGCIGKVKVKKINGDTWMLIKADVVDPCITCKYCANVKINYCKNAKVYYKLLEDDKQLNLPFK